MYLHVSFHRSCVNHGPHSSVDLHEQMGCIAVTKLVWSAMILNSSMASGPLINGRALKMYSWVVYCSVQKSFEAKEVGGEAKCRRCQTNVA